MAVLKERVRGATFDVVEVCDIPREIRANKVNIVGHECVDDELLQGVPGVDIVSRGYWSERNAPSTLDDKDVLFGELGTSVVISL